MSPQVKASYLLPVSLRAIAALRGLHVRNTKTPRIQGRIVGRFITRTDTGVFLHGPGQKPKALPNLGPALEAALLDIGITLPSEPKKPQKESAEYALGAYEPWPRVEPETVVIPPAPAQPEARYRRWWRSDEGMAQ